VSFRKLLDEERKKVTLFWVLGNIGIPGNKISDKSAKSALEDDLLATKRPTTRSD
jgi:ribonuclease HI